MASYLDKTGLTYLWGKITSALSGKQATLVSGTNIKTINNESILGSGNISVSGGSGDAVFVYTLDASNLNSSGTKTITSAEPYTAIHAAYTAGKDVYVKLDNFDFDMPEIIVPLVSREFAPYAFILSLVMPIGSYFFQVNVDSSKAVINFQPMNTYFKPSGGIPASDIASGVIPTNCVSSTTVTNVVYLTQAAYDALATKDANTLYIIPES